MTRTRWLALALGIYFVATLISMASMSIGLGIFISGLLYAFEGPVGVWRALRAEWRDNPTLRTYCLISTALLFTLLVSLVAGKIWPLGYDNQYIEVNFLKDMAKARYLFYPPFFLIAWTRIDEADRKRVMRAWLIAFGLLSIFGVIQHFVGWPRYVPIGNTNGQRFHTLLFLGQHLSVANVLLFPLFACLDYITKKDLILPRNLLILFTLAGAAALFFTYSRMAWIAVPIAVFVWAVISLPRKQAWLLAAVIAVITYFAGQLPTVQARWEDFSGITTRRLLWQANFEFWKERPLTGTGWHHNLELSQYYLHWVRPGLINFVGHAHNNFIEMLAGTGLIGASAWIGWCAWIIYSLWRLRKNSGTQGIHFARGLFCAWIAFHISGMTQVNFWEAKVLHSLMLMVGLTLYWSSDRRAA